MMSNEAIPHQKSLVAISIGLILFGLGNGEVKDSVSFALIGVTLKNPIWLLIFVWLSLLWSFWRFWINNNIQSKIQSDINDVHHRDRSYDTAWNKKYFERKHDDLKWSSVHTGDQLAQLKNNTHKKIQEGKEFSFKIYIPNQSIFWRWLITCSTEAGQLNGVKFYTKPLSSDFLFQLRLLFKAAVSSNSVADFLVPVLLFIVAFVVNGALVVPFYMVIYWIADRCMDYYPEMEVLL